jgi:hypothetical protein
MKAVIFTFFTACVSVFPGTLNLTGLDNIVTFTAGNPNFFTFGGGALSGDFIAAVEPTQEA